MEAIGARFCTGGWLSLMRPSGKKERQTWQYLSNQRMLLPCKLIGMRFSKKKWSHLFCKLAHCSKKHWNGVGYLKPLSQWEVTSDDLELPRCKSTVKAICIGWVNSANYPDQWSDATFIRCKCHCESAKLFLSLLGGAALAAISRDFRSVLHLRLYRLVYWFIHSMSIERRDFSVTRVYISLTVTSICCNDKPRK